MDIITDAVKKLEALTEHSGCTDAGVILDVDPHAGICQFERGVSMTATFGGRSAVFSTYEPIRAPTKIAFMFDAPLDTIPVRGAAAAIINVVMGFLCMSRVLHACQASSHTMCHEQLQRDLEGKKIFCSREMRIKSQDIIGIPTENPKHADIILINGEGLISADAGDLIETYRHTKRIMCIGPSTGGIARLYEIEHWCPFGRSCRD